MRTFFILFLFIFVAGMSGVLHAEEEWHSLFSTEKSEHFIIRYRCDKSVVASIKKHAEQYYDRIENDFELTRYSDFWTWENRCEIILFASQEEYRIATRQPHWSGGHVDYQNRIIYSFPWAEGFIESLLPHELAHIMFREYMKDNQNIPLWLDEGIAQYVEKGQHKQADAFLIDAVRESKYIPFEQLQSVRVLAHTIGTQEVHLFYAQSRSIINLMIRDYGKSRFAYFLSQLRAGKTVPQSLRFSYPKSINSLKNLEEKWLDMMR